MNNIIKNSQMDCVNTNKFLKILFSYLYFIVLRKDKLISFYTLKIFKIRKYSPLIEENTPYKLLLIF